jgi:hypothetical protein
VADAWKLQHEIMQQDYSKILAMVALQLLYEGYENGGEKRQ